MLTETEKERIKQITIELLEIARFRIEGKKAIWGKEVGVYSINMERAQLDYLKKITIPGFYQEIYDLFGMFHLVEQFREMNEPERARQLGMMAQYQPERARMIQEQSLEIPANIIELEGGNRVQRSHIQTLVERYAYFRGDKEYIDANDQYIIPDYREILAFDESSFQDRLRELENYLDADEIEWLEVAPLVNVIFEDRTTDISFDGGLRIRPVREEELVHFVTRRNSSSKPTSSLTNIYHVVEVRYSQKKEAGYDSAYAEKIKNFRSFLRIFKKGNIVVGDPYRKQIGWGPMPYQSSGRPLGWIDINKPLRIINDEIPRLTSYWSIFNRVKRQICQSVALRRFEQSLQRKNKIDRIIDLSISLEALVLIDLKYELKFRFAVYTANTLVNDTNDIETIYKGMGWFYDLRSTYVHGSSSPSRNLKNKVQAEFESIDNLIDWVEDKARELFRLFINEGADVEQWKILLKKNSLSGHLRASN